MDNVNVEHRHTAGSVISVSQDPGIIRIVRDAYVMDTRTRASPSPEYVSTAKVLRKERTAIGNNNTTIIYDSKCSPAIQQFFLDVLRVIMVTRVWA